MTQRAITRNEPNMIDDEVIMFINVRMSMLLQGLASRYTDHQHNSNL